MRIDVEDYDDFIQYYRGHLVRGREEGFLYHVSDRGEDGNTVIMNVYKDGRLQERHKQFHFREVQKLIYFGIPRLGMVVVNDMLGFLSYDVARQGGRGFDPSRVQVTTYGTWGWERASGRFFPAGAELSRGEIASQVLFPKRVDWERAHVDLLNDTPTRPAYALTWNFGIYLDSGFVHPLLVYKDRQVGELVGYNRVKLAAQYGDLRDLIGRAVSHDIQFVEGV